MPCSLAIDILSSSRKVLISPLCLAPTLPDSMSANISEESAYPETRIAVPIDLKNSTIFSRMVSALGVISLNSLALYISAMASSTYCSSIASLLAPLDVASAAIFALIL